MSVFYDRMQDVASDLLERFGQVVTFTRITGGGIDPVTGVSTQTTTTIETVGTLRRYPNALIDGTRIQSTDRELVIRATEIEPRLSDTVTVDGATYAIQEVQTSSPAGTDLAHFVRVRA
jgi:hypothetical protein